MRYVDGCVLPAPKRSLKAYLRLARMGEAMWRKHGPLDYKECVVDANVMKAMAKAAVPKRMAYGGFKVGVGARET